jgi:hypothetical protein
MARAIITGVGGVPQSSVASRTNNAYNTEGVVESVEDIIELISPYETPFYSQIEKGDVKDRLHYWQEDVLEPAVRNNAVIAGWEPVTAASWNTSTPGMKSNFVQTFLKTARVTGQMRAVDTYGRGDELDYQIMKRGRELKRDIESSLLADSTGVVGGGGTGANAAFPQDVTGATAATLTGAFRLINTGNLPIGATSAAGAGSVFAGQAGGDATGAQLSVTTPGTNRPFTEIILLAAQKAVYDAGGTPTQAIMSAFHAQIMANFAYIDPTTSSGLNAGTRVRQIASDNAITNVVDMYKSPYGTIAVVIDRFVQGNLPTETKGFVLLADPDFWKLGVLRPMQSEMLAKTGDNDKAMLIADYTLIHKNTSASGAIRDLNVT